jgi:hypothetical protein
VCCLIGGGIRFQRLILNQSGVGAAISFRVGILRSGAVITIGLILGWLLVKIIGFADPSQSSF